VSELHFRIADDAPENIRSIFDRCIQCLQHPLARGHLSLVIPGMKPASQQSRYLVGRNSPKGEIVADGDGNTQIVSFKALDILAWMTANKFCTAAIPLKEKGA
jgi:hypothetical protein